MSGDGWPDVAAALTAMQGWYPDNELQRWFTIKGF
jgi:hypothetical protein